MEEDGFAEEDQQAGDIERYEVLLQQVALRLREGWEDAIGRGEQLRELQWLFDQLSDLKSDQPDEDPAEV